MWAPGNLTEKRVDLGINQNREQGDRGFFLLVFVTKPNLEFRDVE